MIEELVRKELEKELEGLSYEERVRRLEEYAKYRDDYDKADTMEEYMKRLRSKIAKEILNSMRKPDSEIMRELREIKEILLELKKALIKEEESEFERVVNVLKGEERKELSFSDMEHDANIIYNVIRERGRIGFKELLESLNISVSDDKKINWVKKCLSILFENRKIKKEGNEYVPID